LAVLLEQGAWRSGEHESLELGARHRARPVAPPAANVGEGRGADRRRLAPHGHGADVGAYAFTNDPDPVRIHVVSSLKRLDGQQRTRDG
jgi:hypothetical protein